MHSEYCTDLLYTGQTVICITEDEAHMGIAAQERLRGFAKAGAGGGKRIVFWVMAAPSAFAWYDAFVDDCRTDDGFASIVAEAEFFQFDDYPISRTDPKFPVTFRHLLKTHLFDRLGAARPPEDHIHKLELTGDDSDTIVLRDYERALIERLQDPETIVIEVKGIGMDGHWGFHGRETPLDAEPEYISIPINRQNRIQQTLDWPEYFPSVDDVSDSASTATVNMFLMADNIIDLVPQPSKRFAVLATYGTNEPIQSIPASALKTHGSSWSFITKAAGESLAPYRRSGVLRDSDLAAIDAIWGDDQESREWARSILVRAGIITTES